MSLKQYKNKADVLASKSSLDGHRWSPTDFSLFITQKTRAFEDPADQGIDYAIEMHVYSPGGDWLGGDHRIESAKIPSIASKKQFLQLDLRKELEEVGIERGSYKLVFNFIKGLLGNTENRSVFVKEISPDRKEVLLQIADPLSTELTPDDNIELTLGKQFEQFKRTVNRQYNLQKNWQSRSRMGFTNLVLNFGNNNIFKVVNARIGGRTKQKTYGESRLGEGQFIYLKLYDKLPTDIVEKQRAWIAQEDKRPLIESVNVYPKVDVTKFNTIKGPNFEVETDFQMNTETDFQAWNDILDTNSSTTQQIVDKMFSGSLAGINLNIDYTSFDNFVKYSSAEQRVKNFKYKLQLIEHYDEQISILNNASGSDLGSLKGNITINTNRKNDVIGGFDGFEKWAYYEQGSGSAVGWPLTTHGVSGSKLFAQPYTLLPYPKRESGRFKGSEWYSSGSMILHHSTSSFGQAWLDGTIASASLYDLMNQDSLANTVPQNISRASDNSQYNIFVNMIGHHYDILYSYINELTRFHRTEEHPKLGIPDELLYDVAKSMGWHLANGNQAESLFKYKLGNTWASGGGTGVTGSFKTTFDQNISKTGSIYSKTSEEVSYEIWRRIVNNLPHILKTKGTHRSIHALMNTYGIPRTLLSIREYGGPSADEQKPDLIEDRYHYALNMHTKPNGTGSYVSIPTGRVSASRFPGAFKWATPDPANDIPGFAIPPITREFRFRPAVKQTMFLASKRKSAVAGKPFIQHLGIEYTASYSGSDQYGRLHWVGADKHGNPAGGTGTSSICTTDWVPLFDGDFWNIRMWYDRTGYEDSTNVTSSRYWNVEHGDKTGSFTTDYKIQVQKASDYITGKIVHSTSASMTMTGSGHYKIMWSDRIGTWFGHGGGSGSGNYILGGINNAGVQHVHVDVYGVCTRFTSSMGLTGSVGDGKLSGLNRIPSFSGSIQEYREWMERLDQAAFDDHTMNPTSYVGTASPTSSYDTLLLRYPFGTDLKTDKDHIPGGFDYFNAPFTASVTSSHPTAHTIPNYYTGSYDGFNNIQPGYDRGKERTRIAAAFMYHFPNPSSSRGPSGSYQGFTETYYIQSPSIGGTNVGSTKIRIEDSKLVRPLSPDTMAEQSRYDYATTDSNRLGLFYSPPDQYNKDIFNQLGGISLDNYFGNPADEFNITYPNLKFIAQEYWKKYQNRNDMNAFIRIFSLFDFSLFTQIKQLIPARADDAMGLIIEPHVLERAKVQVTEQPSFTEPFYEQRLQLYDHQLSGSTTPISGAINVSISEDLSGHISGSPAFFGQTGSLEKSNIKLSEGITISGSEDDTSSTNLISHEGSNSRDTAFLGIIGITYSSSMIPSNYRLENLLLKRTFKGIDYAEGNVSAEQPVIVTDYQLGTGKDSHETEVDYDRTVSASSAFQAVILEQRKSTVYKKKISHYFPIDKATRHYKLDKVHGNTFHDSTTAYAHSAGFKRVRTQGAGVIDSNLSGTDATFTTMKHNYFTGSALLFKCLDGPMSASGRGATYVQIPTASLYGPVGSIRSMDKPRNWSLSVMIQPTSASGTTEVCLLGALGTSGTGEHSIPRSGSSLWIAKDGTLALRDADKKAWGTIFTDTSGVTPNSSGSTYQTGSKIEDWPASTSDKTYNLVVTFKESKKYADTYSSGSVTFVHVPSGSRSVYATGSVAFIGNLSSSNAVRIKSNGREYQYIATTHPIPVNRPTSSLPTWYFATGSTLIASLNNLTGSINSGSHIHRVVATNNSASLLMLTSSEAGTDGNAITIATSSVCRAQLSYIYLQEMKSITSLNWNATLGQPSHSTGIRINSDLETGIIRNHYFLCWNSGSLADNLVPRSITGSSGDQVFFFLTGSTMKGTLENIIKAVECASTASKGYTPGSTGHNTIYWSQNSSGGNSGGITWPIKASLVNVTSSDGYSASLAFEVINAQTTADPNTGPLDGYYGSHGSGSFGKFLYIGRHSGHTNTGGTGDGSGTTSWSNKGELQHEGLRLFNYTSSAVTMSGAISPSASADFVRLIGENGDVKFTFVSASSAESYLNTSQSLYVVMTSSLENTNVTSVAEHFRDVINNSGSSHRLNISASNDAGVVILSASNPGPFKVAISTGSGDNAPTSTISNFATLVNVQGGTFTTNGTASFYVNGKLQYRAYENELGHTSILHQDSGRFWFDSIGFGAAGGHHTYGFSGSMAQLRLYNGHTLNETEIHYLNNYPHLRANRDRSGNEIFTRREGSIAARPKRTWIPSGGPKARNLFYALEPIKGAPTSYSLEPADYRENEFTGYARLNYEGCKLTAPDWNINSTQTTDGGPVVSFTITNPNTLETKEGNLTVD